jgi:hypothetical protein
LALQDLLIKPPKKRPVDMANLCDATEPIEQAITFSIIDSWSLVNEADDI